MRRLLVIAALALPAVAHSQLPDTPAPVAQQVPPIGSRVRVRAEGILAGRQKATILRHYGDTVTLAIKGDDPVAVPLSRIASFETSLGTSRPRGMVRGAVVVSAIFAGFYALDAQFGDHKDECVLGNQCLKAHERITEHGLLESAGAGGAFGLLVGWFWPTEAWRRVDLVPRVSIGVAPRGMVTAGISLTVR
ncbi:MAG: hypothetical protein ABI601_13715 [bacterium]